MLIFLKARLVVFATPKTASTSIEDAIGAFADIRITKNPNAKHTPYRKYKRHLKPFVETFGEDFACVAVMREPTQWLGSWFRYRSRDALAGKPNSTASMDFEAFIEAYLQDTPPACARVGSQAKFLTDNQGRLGMDHLFRYEDMPALQEFLQDRLNFSFELGHANRSPDGQIGLSPDLEQKLRAHCAQDFELYENIPKIHA